VLARHRARNRGADPESSPGGGIVTFPFTVSGDGEGEQKSKSETVRSPRTAPDFDAGRQLVSAGGISGLPPDEFLRLYFVSQPVGPVRRMA
jgi:hypothetical protein